MRRRRIGIGIALAVLAAAASVAAAPDVSAAAFVLDLSGAAPRLGRWLPARTQQVTEADVSLNTRHGALPARLYRSAGRVTRGVLVIPGIHAGGVDEPRLVAFSRRLAAEGLAVVSLPLPELRRYVITPVSTETIEDAVISMAADPALAPDGRADVAAVSFAGGLALVAAGRPALRGKVGRLIVLGGHADLPRVLKYLCTGRLPDGRVRAPHDYGVVIILLAALPKLVPADQLATARDGVLRFLDASSYASIDAERSAMLFAEARAAAAAAPEPSRTLLALVNGRDVAALGARLLPYVEELGGAPALSPARSPAPAAPVFLVHGEADNVIPSSETPLLAEYLARQGNARVRWLLTPLLSHADVGAAAPLDTWRLIRFWKQALEADPTPELGRPVRQ